MAEQLVSAASRSTASYEKYETDVIADFKTQAYQQHGAPQTGSQSALRKYLGIINNVFDVPCPFSMRRFLRTFAVAVLLCIFLSPFIRCAAPGLLKQTDRTQFLHLSYAKGGSRVP